MKPVFQEIIDEGTGDCFSACLASILELPIGEVPKFRRDHGREMMKAARKWCAENFGLSIITIQMEDLDDEELEGKDIRLIGAVEKTPCIAGGKSPNLENCSHAVVGELDRHGMNFDITHDPNPSGKGIVGRPTHLYFLVPMKPENFIMKK